MSDLDLSGRKVGEFVLRERIGAGGYSTVYRCEQPALKRDAVVKVLHAGRVGHDPDQERLLRAAAQERFLREAQLASRLDHPYAAHVYSFGVEQSDGLLWIAMERVQGITLGEWLRAHGPMPLVHFVPFLEAVAQVVQAAHERGIVHRDLKPSNIMVLDSGGRLLPKLLDFGIAKLNAVSAEPDRPGDATLDAAADGVPTVKIRVTPQLVQRTRTGERGPTGQLTQPGAMLGSAPYMSPEQWGSPHAVGPATDIYSLGCVAYEMLAGRVPFAAEDTGGYFDRHLRADPPPLGASFSPSLDRVLRRALAKDPDARPASALDLAAELAAAARSDPRQRLRSAAQEWHAHARAPGLLWGRDALAEIERSTLRAPRDALGELEYSFIVASRRRARVFRWATRSIAALVLVGVLGALQYRSAMQARITDDQARLATQEVHAARALADARTLEGELEQGRAALLHGEPEALPHLARAYRGEPSPTTAFMLARAAEPRLAERARFASTSGRMWWAAFSPDGRQIVTTDDRGAQIWDGQTHALLFALPHGCEVYQAVYGADGKRLVTVGKTMVRIWDTSSGGVIRELEDKPGEPTDYFRGAISRDGALVAAIDAAGATVRIWNAQSGALVVELHFHAAGFPNLAFDADRWFVATGGDELRVYDQRTWTSTATIPGPIRGLALDGHGHLATGAANGDAALWEIPGGKKLRELGQFPEAVDSIAFSPDGRLVAAGSRDGAMQVWQVTSGVRLSQLNPRHGKILEVEFDPSSRLLLAANADGTVVVADAAQGLQVAVLEGPQGVVRTAGFGPDQQVVGASWDGTARLWDAASPFRRFRSDPVGSECGRGMGAAPEGRFMAIGCGMRPTAVWDTAHDRLLAELPAVTPIVSGGYASAVPAISADGNRAAIARGNAVALYEIPGGRLLRTIEHRAAVSAVAFASDGRDVATGAIDGSTTVTHDDGSREVLPARAGVDAVELLPDGRLVVSDAARRLRVYGANGAILADLETPSRIRSLRRDGDLIVALPSYTGPVVPPALVDLERYRIVALLDSHTGQVLSARWTRDHRIITAGADGTARLWDGATGLPLQTYTGGPRFLADAMLTPDGLVIGGDADGLVRFWDAATGEKLWILQAHSSPVIGVHLAGDGSNDIVTLGLTGELSRWQLRRPEQVIDLCARQPHCAVLPP